MGTSMPRKTPMRGARAFWSVAVFLAVITAAPLFGQGDPMNQPVEPFRIAGNLYYVGASDVTSFLITTPRGHILLDGGFAETAPMIVANVARLGFRLEDVKVLLNSHAHLDHAGGLAELKRITGATFYASRRDIPLLARGGLDDPQFGNRFPYPRIYADRIIEHGSHVRLGGVTMTAQLTPGHTPGCTTWTTTIGEHDVVFVCSASVPSEYRLRHNPRYPDAIADYQRTFEVLKSLTPDIFLASHGQFFGLEEKRIGQRSFVDRDGYRSYIDAAERRFGILAKE
jgi:metallo-beta-lactamase class B